MADIYQKINSIYKIDLIDKNRKTGTDYKFGGPNNNKFTIQGAKLLTTIPDTDLSTIGPNNTVILSNLNLQTSTDETEENVYLKIRPVLRFGSASNEYMYQELEQELCLHVNSTARLKLPSDSMIIKTGKVGAANQTNSVAMHQVSQLGSETIDYQCIVETHPINNTHFKVVFEIQLTDGGTDGVSKETFPVSATNIKVQYAKFETAEVGDLGLGGSPTSLSWQTVTAPVSAVAGTNDQTKFIVTIPDLKFDESDYDTEYAFRWKNESDPSNSFSKITTIRILHVDVVEKYVTFVSPTHGTAFVGTPSVEVKLGNIGKDNTVIEQ
jgi:hypothetical protein